MNGRTALQLSAWMSAGLVSAEAIAERTLAAIAACDDQAIFTVVTAERARAEAKAAARRLHEGRPASIFVGFPTVWTHLFDLEGLPTTAGSRLFESAPPAKTDAAVVSRLKD